MSFGEGYLKGREGISGPFSQPIDTLFERFDRPHTPGLAVAVVKDGVVVHQRGYGVANIEDDVPISSDTVFRLGSVSKQFCATGILLLEDRAELSLDDDVRRFVPEMPDYGLPITLRHLLTMTSGLPDGLGMALFSGLHVHSPISRAQILAMQLRQSRPMFPPGDDCTYCNTNYALLSLICERISGRPLATFLHDEIFLPLGMNSTRLTSKMTDVVPRKSRGYQPAGYWDRKDAAAANAACAHEIGVMQVELSGDGGIDTTITDMVKWTQHYRRPTKFGPNYRERMETRGILNDGQMTAYACGLTVMQYRGLRRVGHAGGMPGYVADFAFYPEHDLGVVLLANVLDVALLQSADRIADLVHRDGIAPAAQESRFANDSDPEIAALQGLYVCEEQGYSLQFVRETDEDFCYLMGEPIRLIHDGPSRYHSAKDTVHVRIEVAPGSPGSRPALHVQFGALPKCVFQPVAPEPLHVDTPDDYVGEYVSDELGECHRVRWENNDLVVELSSPLRTLLWRSLSRRIGDVFTAEIPGEPSASNVTVRFVRGPNGSVHELAYALSRIRGVTFRKMAR